MDLTSERESLKLPKMTDRFSHPLFSTGDQVIPEGTKGLHKFSDNGNKQVIKPVGQ